MIDGAQSYNNDVDIGRAIRKAIDEGIVTREELFIAHKLSDEKDGGYKCKVIFIIIIIIIIYNYYYI